MNPNLPDTAAESEYASFYVAEALMGIPIGQVEEINHNLDLTPVPHAPAWVCGVMNLRGAVVTVIDLRVVLGLEPTVITRKTCNVVVRSGTEQIGLLADRVADVVRARRSEIEAPPANVVGSDGRFFRGVYQLERELLVLLDIDAVLAGDATMA
jgi:purine-binding chemotaxis protein CheW